MTASVLFPIVSNSSTLYRQAALGAFRCGGQTALLVTPSLTARLGAEGTFFGVFSPLPIIARVQVTFRVRAGVMVRVFCPAYPYASYLS